ncbi:MAG TPA: SCO family protein [Chthoniobacterales bacterium]|nr:SCO family protein [Chthoniobacterales bacterium]
MKPSLDRNRGGGAPGSARVSRAGDGVSPSRPLTIDHRIKTRLGRTSPSKKVRFGGTPKPTRKTRALPGLALLAFLLSAIPLIAQTQQEQIASRAGLEQKLNSQVPLDAVFRDEHGNAVQLGSFFHRKPVILALAYYECPNLCTLVLNGVLQTADELKFNAGEEYEIVVVSFDARERPGLAAAKKQIYIQRYGRTGAAKGWHFLTGDATSIARLTKSVGYRFAYDETTRQFAHPSAIMVLTPAGKVARYFPGIEYSPRDVRLALIEASHERVGSLADRVFLLCFHYNPATGKYGLLISRVLQFAGVGTAAVLALYIIWMLRREREFAH